MVIDRRKSRLSELVQRELLQHFVAGTPARTAALLAGVNRHTATLYFHKLREKIADHLRAEVPELFSGEVEVDESYFGGHRKGKHGRGASGKVPVFGLLKRGGKVHTVIITSVASAELMPIMRGRIKPDSIVYTDSFPSYMDLPRFSGEALAHLLACFRIELGW